jgi:hypothetical protein
MNTGAVTLVVALLGFAGTIGAAFITRPRDPLKSQQPPQPRPQQSQSRSQSYPQQTWWPPAAGNTGHAPPVGQPGGVRPVKISVSLWLGLAGLILWIIPILGALDLLPGLFIAIRDLRSPGTRRYAVAGLALCLIAFTLTIINSAIGAYQGYHGTGWWQH